MNMNPIAAFEIPEELGKELSKAMIVRDVRTNMVASVIGKPWYSEMEASLVEAEQDLNRLKAIVTRDYVPEEYADSRYQWNYPGFETSGTTVYIMDTTEPHTCGCGGCHCNHQE